MPKNTRKVFVVEGPGPFPMDMLRYDSAWPRESVDAVAAMDDRRERRKVSLLTDSHSAPTVDRWRSFGWVVVETVKLQ